MRAILDSGPLIALWNAEREHLSWIEQLFLRFSGPYYVTEPVLTEVAHLTGRDKLIVSGLRSGKFLLPEGILDQLDEIERSLKHFPHCDLADASVIALSERYRRVSVLSIDRRHFVTYRRHDGSPLPMVLPEA
jgi:predicted nucleic acid-binding protein